MHNLAALTLQDLARAQEDYVMTTDMHLTYLITPVDLSAWDRRGPNWSCLYQMLHSLQVGLCCAGMAEAKLQSAVLIEVGAPPN